MSRALYREWFVEFRFPGHESVNFVDSALGKIPEGWMYQLFGDVVENHDRKRIPLSKIQRASRQGLYPYYGASGIIDHVNDYLFKGRYLLIAEDGENLNSRKLPVAFFANGKFWVNNHAHIIQGKGDISIDYLYLMFAESDIRGYITGAAQPKLSQANLNRIPVLVATTQIIRRFNETVGASFRQVEVLTEASKKLRDLRDLILPRLLSGQIDVSEMEKEQETAA